MFCIVRMSANTYVRNVNGNASQCKGKLVITCGACVCECATGYWQARQAVRHTTATIHFPGPATSQEKQQKYFDLPGNLSLHHISITGISNLPLQVTGDKDRAVSRLVVDFPTCASCLVHGA